MTRIIDTDGIVHFRNPNAPTLCLCGMAAICGQTDLFGNVSNQTRLKRTDGPVNCIGCARVVCAIRNEPYNTILADITEQALAQGVLGAVYPDGEEVRHDQ